VTAVSGLIAARLRRRPGRYVLCVVGVAVAVGFAGSVLAESTVAGDRAAREVLAGGSALGRTVRISSSGVVTPAVQAQLSSALGSLGLRDPTEVLLLGPVRLSGVVVRLAAVAPLGRWLGGAPRAVGGCAASDCPMVLLGGSLRSAALTARGVRIVVAGAARIGSAAPLGFVPGRSGPPVLVSGDIAGLDRIAGLSGTYRSRSWIGSLPVAGLHSWGLDRVERRLQAAQQQLLSSDSSFTFTGPFTLLDAARARASTAPDRLLLAGGGALAALVGFIVLAAGVLRRELSDELARLRLVGARSSQLFALAAGEAGIVSAAGLATGAAIAVVAGLALGDAAAVGHALLRWQVLGGAVAAWSCVAALICSLTLIPSATLLVVGDLLSVAALAALALALARGSSGSDPLPVLLAPLACLAGGALVFRGAAFGLRACERLSRGGPPLVRVALTGLARGPGLASLAIASIAISTGLGGFALSYRATLKRSASDQAADRVPLDATLAPGADFRSPLELAPLARWRELAGGPALPIRRTDAGYVSGGATVTVPALGLPASSLPLIRGWRSSDGSAPLATLAARLRADGPSRAPGPLLPVDARWLTIRARAPAAVGVTVVADLRGADGAVTQLRLGVSDRSGPVLRARVPPGRWELAALELDETTGLEVTNGHQNGENPAAATRFSELLRLGPAVALDRRRVVVARLDLSRWRGVGAASSAGPGVIRFATTGLPGIVRPAQPSDSTALPVLVDPRTAAATGRGGALPVTIDGVAVQAKVVGTVRRWPTVASDASGLLIADVDALAGALDAASPGQGRANELWLSLSRGSGLRGALRAGPLAGLTGTFRADVEHGLAADPIARGVLGTLLAAALTALALAVVGLLAALIGGGRDRRLQAELAEQGVGPRGIGIELRLRFGIATVAGVVCGIVVAVALTGLAVAAVRAALGPAHPPAVAVVPVGGLVAWALVAFGALGVAGWLGTLGGRGGSRGARGGSLGRRGRRSAAGEARSAAGGGT
jgi:hypothetical protein